MGTAQEFGGKVGEYNPILKPKGFRFGDYLKWELGKMLDTGQLNIISVCVFPRSFPRSFS